MSVYIGKSMDTFEEVWNMWMQSAGVEDFISADVISFRCFAYSFGEDITRWFSPVQPIHRALGMLCSSLEIENACSVIPASVWGGQLGELEWPVLLVDVDLNAEVPALREKFYCGVPYVCLLCRHVDGKHLVYTSSGVPFMEFTEEQVIEKICGSMGYVLTRERPIQVRRPSAKEVLRKGLLWRSGTNLPHADIFKREWNRCAELSIQYGLMNYQIQLSKIVRFCAQEIQVPDSVIEELNRVLLRIGSVIESRAYEKIVKIEKDFWAMIENIEENSHV